MWFAIGSQCEWAWILNGGNFERNMHIRDWPKASVFCLFQDAFNTEGIKKSHLYKGHSIRLIRGRLCYWRVFLSEIKPIIMILTKVPRCLRSRKGNCVNFLKKKKFEHLIQKGDYQRRGRARVGGCLPSSRMATTSGFQKEKNFRMWNPIFPTGSVLEVFQGFYIYGNPLEHFAHFFQFSWKNIKKLSCPQPHAQSRLVYKKLLVSLEFLFLRQQIATSNLAWPTVISAAEIYFSQGTVHKRRKMQAAIEKAPWKT